MLGETGIPVGADQIRRMVHVCMFVGIGGGVAWALVRAVSVLRKRQRADSLSGDWRRAAEELGVQYFPGAGGVPGSVWGQTPDGRSIGISAEARGLGPSRRASKMTYVPAVRVGLASDKSSDLRGVAQATLDEERDNCLRAAAREQRGRLLELGVAGVEVEEDWIKVGSVPPMMGSSGIVRLTKLLIELAEQTEAAVVEKLATSPAAQADRDEPGDQGTPPAHCPQCGAHMLAGKWVCQMCDHDARESDSNG